MSPGCGLASKGHTAQHTYMCLLADGIGSGPLACNRYLLVRRPSPHALNQSSSRERAPRRRRSSSVAGAGAMAVDQLVPEWYSGETLYRDSTVEACLGPNGTRQEYVNAEGMKLATYRFPSRGSPKGLVIMVHGHGCSLLHEYLFHKAPGKPGIYGGSMVEKLNKAGIAAAGIDLQGCGHSEGLRCYVDSYQDYVDDVLGFTKTLEDGQIAGFSGLPTFVMGISLGGCIASDICRQSDVFKGAVLFAPMLSLERVSRAGLNPYLRPLSSLLSWLVPTAKIIKTTRNNLYPEIQAFFDEDPQTWKENTRARNAYEYLTATEQLCANMGTFKFPFACYHGEVDTMTDPEGSKKLYAESQAEDKKLNIIPNRWHVLMKEEGAEKLQQDAVDWISKRT